MKLILRNRKLLVDRVPSPLGTLLCVVNDATLCALDFEDYEPRLLKHLQQHYDPFELNPCHLTGYAGGLERKRWLLNHEGVELPETVVQLGLVLS